MDGKLSAAVVRRFWGRVNKGLASGCWEWTGGRRHGYGCVRVDGKTIGAHRMAYELVRGGIPAGLHIDHLCRNRACVNPAHLEPVTNKVNVLRGTGKTAENARKVYCPRGHPLLAGNLVTRRNGRRECRACATVFQQLRRRGRRAHRRTPCGTAM